MSGARDAPTTERPLTRLAATLLATLSPLRGAREKRRAPRAKQKARPTGPGLLVSREPGELLRRRDFRDEAFERLVGLLREVGVELAELGRLRDEAFVGALHVFALHLDRLLQRLGAEQLLERGAAVLEALLRVVGEFGRDRLPALRHGAELLHGDVHVVFSELLNVFEILEHRSPLAARIRPRLWLHREAGRNSPRHLPRR